MVPHFYYPKAMLFQAVQPFVERHVTCVPKAVVINVVIVVRVAVLSLSASLPFGVDHVFCYVWPTMLPEAVQPTTQLLCQVNSKTSPVTVIVWYLMLLQCNVGPNLTCIWSFNQMLRHAIVFYPGNLFIGFVIESGISRNVLPELVWVFVEKQAQPLL